MSDGIGGNALYRMGCVKWVVHGGLVGPELGLQRWLVVAEVQVHAIVTGLGIAQLYLALVLGQWTYAML